MSLDTDRDVLVWYACSRAYARISFARPTSSATVGLEFADFMLTMDMANPLRAGRDWVPRGAYPPLTGRDRVWQVRHDFIG